jgi:predicted nucleotidyltransferase component of viral defense system
VGDILTALRSITERIGFDRVTTDIGRHPKARSRSTFAGGGAISIKIEINTFERSPAQPVVARNYSIDSPWFTGAAAVPSFDLPELVATKIRALFRRSKGRDLFDLWLAVRHAGAAPEDIAACFEPYRPDGYTAHDATEVARTIISTIS